MSDIDIPTACPTCASKTAERLFPTSFVPLGIHEKQETLEKIPPSRIEDVRIENTTIIGGGRGTGISAKNGYLKGKNIKIYNMGTAINAKNSDISIENLQIK